MAEPTKSNTPAAPATNAPAATAAPQKAKKAKVYEIVHGTVAVDPSEKRAPRKVGDEIREGELDAKTIEMLVKEGILRDTAAPLAPEAVTEHVLDHFIEVGQQIGLVANDGATYTFADREFKGLSGLRAGITTAELKASIVAAFTAKK